MVPETSNQAEPDVHTEPLPGLIQSGSVLHMIEVHRPLLDFRTPSVPIEAVFQLPFEDRVPKPGDTGSVVVVDLETGQDLVVTGTRGWEAQVGANVNWGATDNELFFNDVDTETWQPFAWKVNPFTGARTALSGAVYHASSDGRFLISSGPRTMRITQPGYGVCVPDEHVPRNTGLSADIGFSITDTSTGTSRLLASIRDLVSRSDPPVEINNPDQVEVCGFHSKFNPQGDAVMVSLRWFPAREPPRWNMFKVDHDAVRYAWVTVSLSDGSMRCAVGPEEWEKGGHHATWFPDGRRISMNLKIDRDVLRLVEVNADGTGLRKMHDAVVGSGHPTVHPDGRHVLTDTYTWEETAYGDGTVPIRWIDLSTGRNDALIRVNTRQNSPDRDLRVDPHPAWDRTWQSVAFNAFVDGTRRVFVADLRDVIG